METCRRGHVLLGSMGLLALLGLTGCVAGSTGTASTAGITDTADTAGITGAVSSDTGNTLFNPEALVSAHNKWRAEVGVPDLQWCDTLAESSQAWADSLKESCSMRHSQNRDYGENIYYAGPIIKMSTSGGQVTEPQRICSEEAVDAWGEEKKWYDHLSGACHGGECGHYTQVVWKDTTQVGCGMAYCPDKAQIWVCQYKKPGNLMGQRPY